VRRIVASRRTPLVLLAIVCALGTGARAFHLGIPAAAHPGEGYIFDEHYYVSAARVIAGIPTTKGEAYAGASPTGTDPNAEHPQLGKLVIAAGMKLLGDNTPGWRMTAVVFGALAILLMYWLVRSAGGGQWLALGAASLASADNLWLVHSRIAVLDIYVVPFMLAGAAFYLRRRPVIAGLVIGVGSCVKEFGAYAVFVLLLLEGMRGARALWERHRRRSVVATAVAGSTGLDGGLGVGDDTASSAPEPRAGSSARRASAAAGPAAGASDLVAPSAGAEGASAEPGTPAGGPRTSVRPADGRTSSGGPGAPSSGVGTPSTGPGTPSTRLGPPSGGPGTPSTGPGTPSTRLGPPSGGPGTPSGEPGARSSDPGTPSSGPGMPSGGAGTPAADRGRPETGTGSPSARDEADPTGITAAGVPGGGGAGSRTRATIAGRFWAVWRVVRRPASLLFVTGLTYFSALSLLDAITTPYSGGHPVDRNQAGICDYALVWRAGCNHFAFMNRYASRLRDHGHPQGIAAHPFDFWINKKAISYFKVTRTVTTTGEPPKTTALIWFRGEISRVLLITGWLALLLNAWWAIRRRDDLSFLVLAWALGTWLPPEMFNLIGGRTTYLYYIVVTMPALYLAVARFLGAWRFTRWLIVPWVVLLLYDAANLYPFRTLSGS
jgi:hypothetical protein